jgi:hypothetical protein
VIVVKRQFFAVYLQSNFVVLMQPMIWLSSSRGREEILRDLSSNSAMPALFQENLPVQFQGAAAEAQPNPCLPSFTSPSTDGQRGGERSLAGKDISGRRSFSRRDGLDPNVVDSTNENSYSLRNQGSEQMIWREQIPVAGAVIPEAWGGNWEVRVGNVFCVGCQSWGNAFPLPVMA